MEMISRKVFHNTKRSLLCERSAKKCNLCKKPFISKSKFDRFCPCCKEQSELLHYVEWIPEAVIH